ncbi:hypothetical protein CYMTET_54911, partial [Cymbomonas tetramitiformis]
MWGTGEYYGTWTALLHKVEDDTTERVGPLCASANWDFNSISKRMEEMREKSEEATRTASAIDGLMDDAYDIAATEPEPEIPLNRRVLHEFENYDVLREYADREAKKASERHQGVSIPRMIAKGLRATRGSWEQQALGSELRAKDTKGPTVPIPEDGLDLHLNNTETTETLHRPLMIQVKADLALLEEQGFRSPVLNNETPKSTGNSYGPDLPTQMRSLSRGMRHADGEPPRRNLVTNRLCDLMGVKEKLDSGKYGPGASEQLAITLRQVEKEFFLRKHEYDHITPAVRHARLKAALGIDKRARKDISELKWAAMAALASSSCSFFEELELEVTVDAVAHLTIAEYEPGELILQQGALNEVFYIVCSGKAHVQVGGSAWVNAPKAANNAPSPPRCGPLQAPRRRRPSNASKSPPRHPSPIRASIDRRNLPGPPRKRFSSMSSDIAQMSMQTVRRRAEALLRRDYEQEAKDDFAAAKERGWKANTTANKPGLADSPEALEAPEDTAAAGVLAAELEPGEFFGDASLISGKPTGANVYAAETTRVLK